jgi:UTP--glucose-1-phosphate uridylyltransferase
VSADGLRASEEKMRGEDVPEVAIDTFRRLYEQLAAGESGLLGDDQIEPLEEVESAADLPDHGDAGRQALDHTVSIKLNGGLGTSMGLERAKSLLAVRGELTFLDVIARQVLALRERHDARLPLVLMNSFHTREESLAALERYPDLAADVPPDFVQNMEPKIEVESLAPIAWPREPELEWCPPGHGDLYTSLVTSGMLEALLEHDYRYAFVSNSDNLGAVLDPGILGWLAAERVTFAMEVADRTAADRKGGHLARRPDGRLVLREIAQTPEEDLDSFQDVERFRYFNTNTLWIDLRCLSDVLLSSGNVLALPMIRNRKTVDPADSNSPAVWQLETAMGAAISVFDGARALRVGRERFAPVKTTNELLGVRSDRYTLTDDARVVLADGARPSLLVDLDPEHFKLVDDFEQRFAHGPPSLTACDRFVVRGDVSFGADVVARGQVEVQADGESMRVEDGTVLEG